LKIIEDSLQDAGVFDDDFNIDFIEIKRCDIKKGGGLTVMIETMEEFSQVQVESSVN